MLLITTPEESLSKYLHIGLNVKQEQSVRMKTVKKRVHRYYNNSLRISSVIEKLMNILFIYSHRILTVQ